MNILLVEINPGLFILGDPPLIVLDEAYSFTFTGYGGAGPYRWALSGSLPTGITWDASTATLSGTTSVPGTFPVIVTIKDAQRTTVSKTFNIVVQILPMQITNSFADYTAGVAQSFTYTSSGGAGTKSWTLTGGTLPDGLSLDSSGNLTGNTTGLSVGSHIFTYTVTVTGSVAGIGNLEESVTVTVVAISITNSAPDGEVDSAYTHTYTSSGGTGTKTWTNTGTLPTSLSLSSSGVLSGTPSVANTFTPTIIVTDNAGTQGTLPESIVIDPAPIAVTWDSTSKGSNITLSNGDKTATRTTTNGHSSVVSTTSRASGKYYFEVYLNNAVSTNGIIVGGSETAPGTNYIGVGTTAFGYYQTGELYNNGLPIAFGATFTTGDVIGVAFDATAQKMWFAKNDTWQASGDPAAGTNEAFSTAAASALFAAASGFYNGDVFTLRAKSADFTYSPPSGFSAWE